MATALRKPLGIFRTFQRLAHEQPVYFYATALGLLGPVMLIVVPPIRRKMGYVKPEPAPYSYPLPQRPRRPTTGYEDE